MTDKATTPSKAVTVQPVEQMYSLPEYGLAVLASCVEDAVEQAKAHVKKSKEKKNV